MSNHPYTRLFVKAAAPTVNDDITLGYEKGDVWLHIGGGAYTCMSEADGAAVWRTDVFDLAATIMAATIQGTPDTLDHIGFVRDSDGQLRRVDFEGLTNNLLYPSLLTYFSDILHDHTGTYSPVGHSHSDPSGLVTPETNADAVFQVTSPGGPSLFIATINGTPSGTSVVYNAPSSGTEAVLVPSATTQLAKMRLYNTTRSNSALISNCNTGTNTITLTATAPANWANGDTISVVSQTVSGGGFNWIDLEVTSGPTGKSALFVATAITSGTPGDALRLHPLSTFAAGKVTARAVAQVAGQPLDGFGLLSVTSNVFSLAWTGTPTTVIIREAAYIP